MASLPHAPLPDPESRAMQATGTNDSIQHRPGTVELMQKTPVELALGLAATGTSNFGGKAERRNANSPILTGKSLDLPVFAGQNARPRPGGGTADAQDLKSRVGEAQVVEDSTLVNVAMNDGKRVGKAVEKTDPELAIVAAAWAGLPATVRARILGLVEGAAATGGNP